MIRAEPVAGTAGPPSVLLRRLALRLKDGSATFDEVLAHLGDDTAVGWLLLLLAVPAVIPSPGLPVGMVFGSAMAVIAVQLVGGARPLTLPRAIAKRRIEGRRLRRMLVRVRPFLRRFERRSRPRLAHLMQPWMLRLLGGIVLIHGLLIALPIPFGNTAPGFSVLVLSLGLILRDGLAVIAGLALSAAAFVVSGGLIVSALWVAEAALKL
jgi:hypothetical protein